MTLDDEKVLVKEYYDGQVCIRQGWYTLAEIQELMTRYADRLGVVLYLAKALKAPVLK